MLNHVAFFIGTWIVKPFQHEHANAWALYGEAFNIISYGCALLATRIDNVEDGTSIVVLNRLVSKAHHPQILRHGSIPPKLAPITPLCPA
jgi:hypothetical protein